MCVTSTKYSPQLAARVGAYSISFTPKIELPTPYSDYGLPAEDRLGQDIGGLILDSTILEYIGVWDKHVTMHDALMGAMLLHRVNHIIHQLMCTIDTTLMDPTG